MKAKLKNAILYRNVTPLYRVKSFVLELPKKKLIKGIIKEMLNNKATTCWVNLHSAI